jgi:hypothetical protein
MNIKDFVGGGGDLKSTLKHDGNLLEKTTGSDCTREVSGPGEKLVESLGLSGNNNTTTSTNAPGTASTTGTTGSTRAI